MSPAEHEPFGSPTILRDRPSRRDLPADVMPSTKRCFTTRFVRLEGIVIPVSEFAAAILEPFTV